MNRTTRRATFTMRPLRLLPAVIAIMLALAACSPGDGKRNADNEAATIKVLYWDEHSFHQDYGMLFYAIHPHIDIEVVSTNKIRMSGDDDYDYDEKLDELIREEKPDILMLNQNQYEEYAADGRLVSLESFITRDKIDLEGFVPGLIDLMREKGGGELYGLAPSFSSRAVYYNKDLFDRFNIEYPTDKMSWEELLLLAARFPTDGSDEDRIWGLNLGYSADLYELGLRIGTTMGLRMMNPADKRISLDTDSWIRVYELALGALNAGTIYQEEGTSFGGSYEDYLLRDPFISGKAAMTFDGIYLMQQLREAANFVPDKAVKNWDLVTMPVDPSNPDYSHENSFHNIFAINADSPSRDAAWAFIRYIHGDDYARVRSKSLLGTIPVRTKYIRDEEGRNLAASYALKPSGADLYAGMENLPEDFFMQLYSIGTEEMKAVMDDAKSVAEALASMQTRLQAVVDQAPANRESGDAAGTSGGGAAETGVSGSTGSSSSGSSSPGSSSSGAGLAESSASE